MLSSNLKESGNPNKPTNQQTNRLSERSERIKIVIAPDSFKENLTPYPMTRARAIKESSKLIPDASEQLMRLVKIKID